MDNFSDTVKNLIKDSQGHPEIPEEYVPSHKHQKFSESSKIAFIGPEDVADDFSYEVDLITPNYEDADFDKLNDVEMIVVCSGGLCAEGWDYFSMNSEKLEHLQKLLKHLKAKKIPSVFWLLNDESYLHFYEDIFSLFDKVYTAFDIGTKGSGNPSYLGAYVQPSKYFPLKFRDLLMDREENTPILLDGWSDMDKHFSKFENVECLQSEDCRIVDSSHLVFKGRVKQTGRGVFKNIEGCVRDAEKFRFYANSSDLVVGLSPSLRPKFIVDQIALKYAACGKKLHILDNDENVKSDGLLNSISTEQITKLVEGDELDSIEMQKSNLLAWREALSQHTLKHRLEVIYNDVLGASDWEEFPKVSIITPTNRAGYCDNVFKNFSEQKYPNLELIIVATSSVVDAYIKHEFMKGDGAKNVQIVEIPDNWYAGKALNMGKAKSSGEYLFRFDNDDEYGYNYVSDMLLYRFHIDFDFAGKPTHCRNIRVDDATNILKLERGDKIRMVYNARKIPVLGNSFCIKRSTMDRHRFDDDRYGDIDSAFIDSLTKDRSVTSIVTDSFNLIISRRSDPTSHTWNSRDFNKKLEDAKSIDDESLVVF